VFLQPSTAQTAPVPCLSPRAPHTPQKGAPLQGWRLRDLSPVQMLLRQISMSAALGHPGPPSPFPAAARAPQSPPLLCACSLRVTASLHGLSPKRRTFLRDGSQFFPFPFRSYPSARLWPAHAGMSTALSPLPALVCNTSVLVLTQAHSSGVAFHPSFSPA